MFQSSFQCPFIVLPELTHFQLLTNIVTGSDDSGKLMTRDEFSECVENINVLNLRLKSSDDRCQRLRTDLRLAKQVCEVIGSPSPPPPPPPLLLSSLLRDSPIHDHRWVQQDPTASASQLVSRWKNLVFKALLLHLSHRGTDNRG